MVALKIPTTNGFLSFQSGAKRISSIRNKKPSKIPAVMFRTQLASPGLFENHGSTPKSTHPYSQNGYLTKHTLFQNGGFVPPLVSNPSCSPLLAFSRLLTCLEKLIYIQQVWAGASVRWKASRSSTDLMSGPVASPTTTPTSRACY